MPKFTRFNCKVTPCAYIFYFELQHVRFDCHSKPTRINFYFHEMNHNKLTTESNMDTEALNKLLEAVGEQVELENRIEKHFEKYSTLCHECFGNTAQDGQTTASSTNARINFTFSQMSIQLNGKGSTPLSMRYPPIPGNNLSSTIRKV